MERTFFSQKNISRQCDLLGEKLNINIKNPRTRKKCEHFVKRQMKNVFKKYGKNRPAGKDLAGYINSMNRKVFDRCFDEHRSRRPNKTQNQYRKKNS